MPALSTLRSATALISLVLLAAGCGGGGDSGDNAQLSGLSQQSFRIADLPETSTNQVGSNQPAIPQVELAVQAILKQYKLPGATVVAMQDDKIVYAKGYGYANLATRTPTKPEDRFEIGSISKQFVAAAALLLVEDGKLALDDRVAKYFAGLPETWKDTTVRHLITHTAGLPENPTPELESQLDRLMADGVSDAERVAALAAVPLLHAPGTTFEYSNLGYNILGMVVSKAAGIDYFELLQQRVFGPLGMTSVHKLGAAPPATPTVPGYTLQGDTIKEFALPPTYQRFNGLGCGALEMNVLDMVKWDAALYGGQILKPSSVAAMAQREVVASSNSWYGLGWFLFDLNGHFMMKHPGRMPAFTTEYRRFRDDHFSVVVFTNIGDKENGVSGALAINRAVTDYFHPDLMVK